MNALAPHDYFLHPTQTAHRRYEALRCVFVDQLSLQEVACRFGVSYGTIRNWVSEFRRELEAGPPPPFSPLRCADDLRPMASVTTTNRKPKSPTRANCRWKRDGDGTLGTRVCSCSCRCWLRFDLTAWSGKLITPARK